MKIELLSSVSLEVELDSDTKVLKFSQKDLHNADRGPKIEIKLSAYDLLRITNGIINHLLNVERGSSPGISYTPDPEKCRYCGRKKEDHHEGSACKQFTKSSSVLVQEEPYPYNRVPADFPVLAKPREEDTYTVNAQWKDDCNGKKDYDGPILSLSTRYWPRGGGFTTFDTAQPSLGFQGPETRPEIKPCANASIHLNHGDDNFQELISKEFEGDTEEEVKTQVEVWAQARFEEISSVMFKLFWTLKDDLNPSTKAPDSTSTKPE